MSKATVNLYFDTRKCEAGKCIVKWSVIHERKPRLFTTGLKVSIAEAKFLKETKNLDNRMKDQGKIDLWTMCYGKTFTEKYTNEIQIGYLERAKIVIAELGGNFTFEGFAEAINNFGEEKEVRRETDEVIIALTEKAERMRSENRIGNATNYGLAAKSLTRFIDSLSPGELKDLLDVPINQRVKNLIAPVLRFKHLTVSFFQSYERWMLISGKAAQSPKKNASPASITTVGIYLRHIRSAFNDAIQKGIVQREDYPFGANRYVIPAGNNIKKALSKADIEKLKQYQPEVGGNEQRSHDLWLFSYFCNGANISDICRLTWDMVDMDAGRIVFIRKKTARSKRHNQTPILARLRPETTGIIKRWGTSPTKEQFVFPWLNHTMTEEEKKGCIAQVIKLTNKWMRRIGEVLNISGDLNTYSARHSFATILVKSDTNLAFISKALGHSSLKTTESYIGSFDDEEAKGYLSNL